MLSNPRSPWQGIRNAALLILIPCRGYWFFESFPKRRTPGVCGAMSKMFVGGCWYFLEKCWKAGGKRTRCPRQPIVDMDVDCRRPRHDENYSSLFVENSHPETLHRDMCIACSGSSWILPMYLTNFPFTVYYYPPFSIRKKSPFLKICYLLPDGN